MRILPDECLPHRLKHHLQGHSARTVVDEGWAGNKNSDLLRLAGEHFDVFVTADQNLRYQQNLPKLKIRVLILVSPNSRLETLLPLLPEIQKELATMRAGDVVLVSTAKVPES